MKSERARITWLLLATAASCRSSDTSRSVAGEPLGSVPAAAAPVAPERAAPRAAAVAIPGGEIGIGFDDLRYSTRLARVLAPAGRTGVLALVDPSTASVEPIGGFSTLETYTGGHGDGTTSVDEGAGFLFAIDRTSKRLCVVDPAQRAIVAHAELGASPDYVRFVSGTRELWVTAPDSEELAIFRLSSATPPVPERAATIEVKGGPESLVVDAKRGRAYTHLWKGGTVAIDVRSREIVATWENGCTGSRGIALDEDRGFLFIGCNEGRVTVIDVASAGAVVSSAAVGEGVDGIAYDAQRRHLYVPSAARATLSILGVSEQGELSVLGTFPAAAGSSCVTTDGEGRVFVADPRGGRLLVIEDPFS